MKPLLFLVLLIVSSQSVALDCRFDAGLSTGRYALQSEEKYNFVKDGNYLGQLAYTCTLTNFTLGNLIVVRDVPVGLDVGPAIATVPDSNFFTGLQTTLGIQLGARLWGEIGVGVVPHWMVGQSGRREESYGVSAYFSADVRKIFDGVASIFTTGLGAAFTDPSIVSRGTSANP